MFIGSALKVHFIHWKLWKTHMNSYQCISNDNSVFSKWFLMDFKEIQCSFNQIQCWYNSTQHFSWSLHEKCSVACNFNAFSMQINGDLMQYHYKCNVQSLPHLPIQASPYVQQTGADVERSWGLVGQDDLYLMIKSMKFYDDIVNASFTTFTKLPKCILYRYRYRYMNMNHKKYRLKQFCLQHISMKFFFFLWNSMVVQCNFNAFSMKINGNFTKNAMFNLYHTHLFRPHPMYNRQELMWKQVGA